ncbi:MAG: 50S ribosomal protein L11 methyltransferase [Bdellovibrionales bacterium]|jgi:ribosomal protein L11 methyltransferase
MPARKNLWFLKFSLPVRAVEAFGEVLGEDAVAVTVLAPPRRKTAQIEALYDDKPKAKIFRAKLAVLAKASNIRCPAFTVRAVPKCDWLKKVARDFPPLEIARWTIHSAPHRKKIPDRRTAIQIDATNAFGTGEHPTTRGCLLMLDKILKTKACLRRMADIGCGSGILAMAFVLGTGGKAVAVDCDRVSAQIAARNVRANGLHASIRVSCGNGYAASLIKKAAPYDLIMANIFANPLCEMAKDLKNNLRPDGIAILSGILKSQEKKVVLAHEKQGLALVERLTLGEWSVLALKCPVRRRSAKNKRERLDSCKK